MTKSVASSVVAIDIGNTKVSAIIARIKNQNTLHVIGMSHVENKGMKQGKITDLGLLTSAIKQAVAEAEEKARCRVQYAWVSIPSEELYCVVGNATLHILDETINTSSMAAVRELAKKQCIKPNYYVTNAIPIAYYINDNNTSVEAPLGMVADKLEAYYHFVMMPVNTMQNIRQALKNANIRVNQIVVSPLATATSCLLEDEKKEGVCLLDIGAEITNIVVYFENKMMLAHSLAMGGELITQDIQDAFQVSYDEANRVKLKYGTLDYDSVKPGEMISLDSLDGGQRTISRADLVEVIIARYRFILKQVYRVLAEQRLAKLPKGVIIAGGGSQITGMVNIAKQELHQAIHLANKNEYVEHADPAQQALLSTPYYQTAVGLAVFGLTDTTSIQEQTIEVEQGFWSKVGRLWQSFVQLFKKVM